MENSSIEKLIFAANYLVRANDTEARGDLSLALNLIISAIHEDVSLHFEQSNRQYRLTTMSRPDLEDPFTKMSDAKMESIVRTLIERTPATVQIATLVYLTTLRLEGKLSA